MPKSKGPIRMVQFRVLSQQADEFESIWRQAGFDTLQDAGLEAMRMFMERFGAGVVKRQGDQVVDLLGEILDTLKRIEAAKHLAVRSRLWKSAPFRF